MFYHVILHENERNGVQSINISSEASKCAVDMFFERNTLNMALVIKSKKCLNVKQTKKLAKYLNKLRSFYEN